MDFKRNTNRSIMAKPTVGNLTSDQPDRASLRWSTGLFFMVPRCCEANHSDLLIERVCPQLLADAIDLVLQLLGHIEAPRTFRKMLTHLFILVAVEPTNHIPF